MMMMMMMMTMMMTMIVAAEHKVPLCSFPSVAFLAQTVTEYATEEEGKN